MRPAGAQPPVIAIDGPTASGKGTIAQAVAEKLDYHYLDSGALYRVVALCAIKRQVRPDDAQGLAQLAETMQPRFVKARIVLDGDDVSERIRTEEVSRAASQVAVHPTVRAALLGLQRRARLAPGLVADGRDMGTVVFPDATLKIFLTASVVARADRRHKQLIEKGFSSNITDLVRDLEARDRRDVERAAAPLKPAQDAYQLDSSALTIDEVVAQVLSWYEAARPGNSSR